MEILTIPAFTLLGVLAGYGANNLANNGFWRGAPSTDGAEKNQTKFAGAVFQQYEPVATVCAIVGGGLLGMFIGAIITF